MCWNPSTHLLDCGNWGDFKRPLTNHCRIKSLLEEFLMPQTDRQTDRQHHGNSKENSGLSSKGRHHGIASKERNRSSCGRGSPFWVFCEGGEGVLQHESEVSFWFTGKKEKWEWARSKLCGFDINRLPRYGGSASGLPAN